jgi:hypothetical protein
MSGPLRFRFAAVLVLTALSTSSASSNPFTALFGVTSPETPPPAPAKEECLPQPGKPADGQHWVYHLEGRRKCWFLVPEETAAVKKPVRRRTAESRPAAAEENEAALRKRKEVADAHAELRPAVPTAETPQPMPPAPALRAVDAAPVPATGAAALVPSPPVLVKPDKLTPDSPDPRQDSVQGNVQGNVRGNMETLFAATPADSATAAVSEPPATPVAKAGEEGRWWTATWIGPLLMVLGGVFLLGSSYPRRRVVPVGQASGEDWPDLLGSEFDSQTPPHDLGHSQATPRRSRPSPPNPQRRSRPLGQRIQA